MMKDMTKNLSFIQLIHNARNIFDIPTQAETEKTEKQIDFLQNQFS